MSQKKRGGGEERSSKAKSYNGIMSTILKFAGHSTLEGKSVHTNK